MRPPERLLFGMIDLFGTGDVDKILAEVRKLVAPGPDGAMTMTWDPVQVETLPAGEVGEPLRDRQGNLLPELNDEKRILRARVRFPDGRVMVFGEARIVSGYMLHRTADPDKLRHHVDNAMRNDLTRSAIEYSHN